MDGLWIFLIVLVACGSFTKIVTAKVNARDRSRFGEEDTRTSQEAYSGLTRLEKRIEALETLLIENEKHARADRVAAEIEQL